MIVGYEEINREMGATISVNVKTSMTTLGLNNLAATPELVQGLFWSEEPR
jgi:hypothetical protein